jgi:hypothetical protein
MSTLLHRSGLCTRQMIASSVSAVFVAATIVISSAAAASAVAPIELRKPGSELFDDPCCKHPTMKFVATKTIEQLDLQAPRRVRARLETRFNAPGELPHRRQFGR